MFVNNKLKESKSVQFLFKSYDNEKCLERFKLAQRNPEDVVPIDLRLASFEFEIADDKIRLKGYIHVNPYLRYLENSYLNLLCRQFVKKFIFNIENICSLPEDEFKNKIIKKKQREESVNFYQFYESELKKFGLFEGNEVEKNEKNEKNEKTDKNEKNVICVVKDKDI
jgi:hypothetical protein